MDDYVEVGYPQSLYFNTADFTYEAWIKTGDLNPPVQQGVIMGKYNHYPMSYIRINHPGRLEARIAASSAQNFQALDGYDISLGQWHHVATVFDRDGNMTRYVDGKVYGQVKNIASMSGVSMDNPQPFNPFRIGRNSAVAAGSGNFFKGQIDDVAVYRRALTAGEIWQQYVTGQARHP